jgi:hypothetical protein
MAGVEEHALSGIGHLQLAAHPKTFSLIERFLSGPINSKPEIQQ